MRENSGLAERKPENLNLNVEDEEADDDDPNPPLSATNITEAQLILLCLDHLRNLRRSYSTKEDMSEINLNSDFISLAIFALDQAFLPPSRLVNSNDPFMLDADFFDDERDGALNQTQFGPTLTTLPNMKIIEGTILNRKDEYAYDDSHQSNNDRFFHLNGLASGSAKPIPGSGGPISLKDITAAGLTGLGASSRVDAENSMVRGPLFEQFLGAVNEKGFFTDPNGYQMQPTSDEYEERYRKVVSKFRSKLAGKAEKALAENYSRGKLITSPNSVSVSSVASFGPGAFNYDRPLLLPHNTSFQHSPQHINASTSYSPEKHEKAQTYSHPKSQIAHDRDIKEAEILKNQGNQHMQAKAYSRAIESYTAALKVLPSGPTSHIYFSNRAAAFLSLKQYKEAIHDSERSIALRPNYGKAHARLGLAHLLISDYAAAVDAYTLALKYEPNNSSTKAYMEKAKRKLMDQQTKQHVGSHSHGISGRIMESTDLDGNRQRLIDQREADKLKIDGNNYISQKKYQEAVECYSTAIALCPSGPSSHVYYSNRSAALCYLERYAEAERDAEISMELNPNYGKAYARLGLSRFFLEDYEGAVDAYNTALQLDPNNAACISYLTKAERKLADRNASFHSIGRNKRDESIEAEEY